MTALPEILAGLFVYVTLIVDFGLPKSGLAASVAMAVTMVPIIARSSEVALRVVPSGLREASSALGASQWRTVRKVVLPSARAGLATAMILAIARGIGETALVLITSGASSFLELQPGAEPDELVAAVHLHGRTRPMSPPPSPVPSAPPACCSPWCCALFVVARLLARDKAVVDDEARSG